MLHLKNAIPVSVNDHKTMLPTGLGDGTINNREFMNLLRDDGFGGPLCIEAPRAGDREWFAQQDIQYLRSVLDDICW